MDGAGFMLKYCAIEMKGWQMIPNPPTMTVPLRTDDNGAIRIGNTRVLLELVIHAYMLGETPESIVDSYSSLTMAEVYAVIAYYLTHRAEIDAYVRARDAKVEAALREMEANMSADERAFRARLRAAREARKKEE
jgi:uncharacterized protein (DUF433 family)